MSEAKQIEKPWCICMGVHVGCYVGKIVEELGESVEVIRAEDQCYWPATWDKKFVKRFETLQEPLMNSLKTLWIVKGEKK